MQFSPEHLERNRYHDLVLEMVVVEERLYNSFLLRHNFAVVRVSGRFHSSLNSGPSTKQDSAMVCLVVVR
ncbi:hypothetical protein E2C01_059197 [Portunus trituberculatus]|uniref:Uncharacterized protein n=1 Tax=Portunus trituberculatus TaxID=210409 RepID=A0A5B7GXE5_PORTR|nr:hypothetical protein [Portunus trituberculatus]